MKIPFSIVKRINYRGWDLEIRRYRYYAFPYEYEISKDDIIEHDPTSMKSISSSLKYAKYAIEDATVWHKRNKRKWHQELKYRKGK